MYPIPLLTPQFRDALIVVGRAASLGTIAVAEEYVGPGVPTPVPDDTSACASGTAFYEVTITVAAGSPDAGADGFTAQLYRRVTTLENSALAIGASWIVDSTSTTEIVRVDTDPPLDPLKYWVEYKEGTNAAILGAEADMTVAALDCSVPAPGAFTADASAVGTVVTLFATSLSSGADSYDFSIAGTLVGTLPASTALADLRMSLDVGLNDYEALCTITARNAGSGTYQAPASVWTIPEPVPNLSASAVHNSVTVGWGEGNNAGTDGIAGLTDGNGGNTSQRIRWRPDTVAEWGAWVDLGADVTGYSAAPPDDDINLLIQVESSNAAGAAVSDTNIYVPVAPVSSPSIITTDESACVSGSAVRKVKIEISDSTSNGDWTGHLRRVVTGTDFISKDDYATWAASGGARPVITEDPGEGDFTWETWYSHASAADTAPNSDSESVVTPVCPAPGAFTLAVSVSGTTASLSWGASAGADSYDVYRGGVLIASALTVLTLSDPSLARDTEYPWVVQARNNNGTTDSNTVTRHTIPNVPSAPAVSNITSSSVRLTRPETPTYFTGWSVRNVTTGEVSATLGPLDTYYDWGSLSQSSVYEFDLEYYNDAGGSGYGANEAITTKSSIPEAPSYVTATPRSWLAWGAQESRVLIEWDDTTSDPAWSAILERTPTGSAIWSSVTTPITCTGGARSHTHNVNGDEGGSYDYRVFFRQSGYADSAATYATEIIVNARPDPGSPGLTVTDDSVCFNGSAVYKKTLTCGSTPTGWTLKAEETESDYSTVIEPLIDSTTQTSTVDESVAAPGGTNYYRAYRYAPNADAPDGVDTTARSTDSQATTTTDPCTPQLGTISASAVGTTASCGCEAGDNCESFLVRVYNNGVEKEYYTKNTSPNGGSYSLNDYTGAAGDVIEYVVEACGSDAGGAPYGDVASASVTLTSEF